MFLIFVSCFQMLQHDACSERCVCLLRVMFTAHDWLSLCLHTHTGRSHMRVSPRCPYLVTFPSIHPPPPLLPLLLLSFDPSTPAFLPQSNCVFSFIQLALIINQNGNHRQIIQVSDVEVCLKLD